MDKDNFHQLLNEYTMDSGEVKEMLGISRSRLAHLKEEVGLTPIKGNLYWKEDVLKRLENRKARRKEE